jgi:hypothetical protein
MDGASDLLIGAISTFSTGATIVATGVANLAFAGWSLITFGIILFTVVTLVFIKRNC